MWLLESYSLPPEDIVNTDLQALVELYVFQFEPEEISESEFLCV